MNSVQKNRPTVITKERLARLATTDDKLRSGSVSVSSHSSRSSSVTSQRRRKNANLRHLLDTMRTDDEEPGQTKRTESSIVSHKLVAEDLIITKKEKAGDNLNFDINEL